ncbi:hypothetical protein A2961_01555 [Candidatus Woesebacteria bacterium RIFCSPLOWO2_01_FULL_39_21]|uniref:Methyltransferase n=1 Tax=Candidatus Woesebacteria bacterium RIFCSPLOWO2_01_FULL_39_21 TaxID=1802519 RepID=A0A1F8BPQ9_9BACT|nr:MAG: hypothetical protein A2691_00855 [Candidatus Woesebacteria bacterium RIFCSPHIGHO2_01_FULL_39_23]OGM65278.1 MAG: hypothetical protein A2961_01555 [Candidatus Woesebacteria bacterium RIFCSPLOWO2_01_FULL_39_21]
MKLGKIVESLPGWCTPKKAQRLFDLVIESNSQITCELGVFGGRSFIPMALAHKQKGTGFALGIDAWRKEASLEGTNSPENNEYWSKINYIEVYRKCTHAIRVNEVDDFCSLIRMRSQDAGFLIADNVIDILHQDSAHNIETITAELNLWVPKVKIGGYWVADDLLWEEAKKGYAKLPEFGLEMIEDHHEWGIFKKTR